MNSLKEIPVTVRVISLLCGKIGKMRNNLLQSALHGISLSQTRPHQGPDSLHAKCGNKVVQAKCKHCPCCYRREAR